MAKVSEVNKTDDLWNLWMSGSDSRMDQRGNLDKPANPWPIKCEHCTFPNLDFVAQPYLLSKGISSPADAALAEVGNFFVRERARRILELVIPDACLFYPTADLKKQPAPWSLAVPKAVIQIANVKASVPRCSKCQEPKVAHPGSHYEYLLTRPEYREHDIFKSLNWSSTEMTIEDCFPSSDEFKKNEGLARQRWRELGVSPPPHPQRWTRQCFGRGLYFSIRLQQLFRKVKLRGLDGPVSCGGLKPKPDDDAWVAEKLRLLQTNGLLDAPVNNGKTAESLRRWFQSYLKRNARKNAESMDFTEIERDHGIVLPSDYKDFVSTVGAKSFEDVNDTEGFVVHVLPPDELDFETCRRGQLPDLDEESSRVDGVRFAETDHGDCFVFDVSAKTTDYPVFWYDHESNCVEPFAENFASCLQRFVKRN